MQLVLDPTRFDMLLLENLYGDIVSDLCAGFIGGLGMAPGANIGEDTRRLRGRARQRARHRGQEHGQPDGPHPVRGHDARPPGRARRPARRVREAVYAVLREGQKLTRDLGGTAGTTEIAEAIAARV